jgi:hypothetical protein
MPTVRSKRGPVHLAVAALLATAVPASSAQVAVFSGSVSFYAQTGTCPTDGNEVGESFVANFRPRNVAAGVPNSDLNLFRQTYAFGYHLPNASFGTSPKKVDATFIGGGSGTDPAATSGTSISFSAVPTITGATKYLVIHGKILGFQAAEQPDCDLTFVFSGARQQ